MTQSDNPGGLSFKAIFLGAGVDLGVSTLIGVVVAAVLGPPIQAVPNDQIPPYVENAVYGSSNMLLVAAVFGTLATVLGGYITGRAAKHSELKHGFVLGCMLLGLSVFMHDSGAPVWFNVGAFVYPIPAAMLGAKLSQR